MVYCWMVQRVIVEVPCVAGFDGRCPKRDASAAKGLGIAFLRLNIRGEDSFES